MSKWDFPMILSVFFILLGLYVDLVCHHSDFGLTKTYGGLIVGFWLGCIWMDINEAKKGAKKSRRVTFFWIFNKKDLKEATKKCFPRPQM